MAHASHRNPDEVRLTEWLLARSKQSGDRVTIPLTNQADLKKLCRGPIGTVLFDIMKSSDISADKPLVSSEQIKIYKQNLTLNRLRKESELKSFRKVQLKTSCEELQEKLTKLRAALENKGSENVPKSLFAKQQLVNDYKCKIADVVRKKIMIQAYNQKVENDVETLKGKCAKIDSMKASFDSTLSLTEDECSVMKNKVEKMCDTLTASLKDNLLPSKQSAVDRKDVHIMLDALRIDLTQVLKQSHDFECFLKAISSKTLDSVDILRRFREIRKLELPKDGERIGFVLTDDGIVPTSSGEKRLLPVAESQCVSRHAENLREFIKILNNTESSAELQSKIADTQQSILNYLNSDCFRKLSVSSEAVGLIKRLIESELAFVYLKEQLEAITHLTHAQRERVISIKSALCINRNKLLKARDFKQITEQKQNLINLLVKHNCLLNSKLLQARSSAYNLLANSLCPSLSSISLEEFDCHSVPYRIASDYASLSSKLPYDVILRGSVAPSHPINLLRPDCYWSIYKGIYDAAKLESTASSEKLGYRVDFLVQSVEEANELMNFISTSNNQLSRNDCGQLYSSAKELIELVNAQEKSNVTTLLPGLEESLKQAQDGIKYCVYVRELLEEWRDESGQYSLPDLTISVRGTESSSGRVNLRQYRDLIRTGKIMALPIH